ncbi:MAG: SDR family NAD(P)-dependent oxidoreductase [Rhodothermales bacterium]
MHLQDKVAVVTGASRGLGRAFAEALAAKGAQVYGLARSEGDLADVSAAIGDAFHPVECDVRDPDDVHRAFKTVSDDAGRCDVLINNAGLGRFGAVEDYDDDAWDVMMDTNVTGLFFCTRAAIPMMKAQNAASGFGGHIVNIASVAGLVGNPNISGYNATKFAVRGFSEAIMKELREDGIKVTCIYPGSVETHFADEAGSSGSANPMQPEDVADTVVHVIEGPDNYLISEVMMRPLRPKG